MIKFSADLDYQQEAISAITNIFEGQDTLQAQFTVAPVIQGSQTALR
jgi:restriction endonuclease